MRTRKKRMFRFLRNAIFWLLMMTAIFFQYLNSGKPYYLALHQSLIYFAFTFIAAGVPAYVNNLWLIPRYLMQRKYVFYFLFLLVLIVAASYNASLIRPILDRYSLDKNPNPEASNVFYQVFMIVEFLIAFALVQFSVERFEAAHQLKIMEKEKLNAEYDNLKSQLNPHFLFNSLNTIYGITRKKDPEAGDAVMLLSDMLRYMLYECNTDRVPLTKEIEYIHNYIKLASLRMRKNARVDFAVDGDPDHKSVVPLLLIPFIENCFKHGIEMQREDPWVRIRIGIHGEELTLHCVNNFGRQAEKNRSGGVGLINVKKRLELSYPGKHTLQIDERPHEYEVNLKIDLHEN